MKITFQDRYTLWHHNPCRNGNPGSNNAWIYSAYSKYLAPDTIDLKKMALRFDDCFESASPLVIHRHPNVNGRLVADPFSKDEVIGVISLGLLNTSTLAASNYNHCDLPHKFDRGTGIVNIYKAIKAFIQINKDSKGLTGGPKRNYMWQNKFTDAYCLGFRLAPWDIYYVKMMAGIEPTLFEKLCFYINYKAVMIRDKKSTKMMLLLQLLDLDSSLIKNIPIVEYVENYFGEYHPFYIGAKVLAAKLGQ